MLIREKEIRTSFSGFCCESDITVDNTILSIDAKGAPVVRSCYQANLENHVERSVILLYFPEKIPLEN